MLRRPFLVFCCVLLLGPAFSAFAASDPSLVGWWWFNEGTGTLAHDSSGYGNDGTLMNGPTWVSGYFGNALQFDGTDDFVEVPHNDSLCVTTGVSVMAWINTPRYEFPGGGYQGIISKGNAPRSYSLYTTSAGLMHFSVGATYVGSTSSATVPQNEWAHVCAMVRDGSHHYFINGVAAGTGGAGSVLPGTTSTASVLIGDTPEASREFGGTMDDVRIYNRGMMIDEIQQIMTGSDLVTGSATSPVPDEGATDVHQDALLTWTPGEFAATHDVYLSTSFADVNDADRANPNGVLVSQGQTAASYDAEDLFEFGQTYYWRVDEVNAAPDNTIFRGAVWSFTVEPFSYPITSVTATAADSRPGMGAENTVNGSGLNADDQHSTEPTHMWMSGVLPNSIQFAFGKATKLDQMLVWNSNQLIEPFIGFGAKTVTIEYSTDGETWTALEGVPEIAQASGSPTNGANTVVDFGGVMAQYVKLTIVDNWGTLPQTGLSEVRFFEIPVQAREPVPADEATDVVLNSELNWRPGREATSHEVLFGTDPDAMASRTVTDHRHTPTGMEFGAVYYWQVNEIGDAGTYAGDLWSFTSQEFATVEDFESYTDEDGSRIYEAWIDGLTTGASGSQVGYDVAPFAEKAIVHSGAQSMPLIFDNSQAPYYSEAEREFDSQQNWTGSGATELAVWTRGYPAPTPVAVSEAGGKMSVTGAGADIWNNSDEFTYAYKTLNGDGTLVARVTSNGTGTNAWAKGGVMIRDSLNGGSTHAMMAMTAHTAAAAAGNGASFQYRATTDGASGNNDSTIVVAPPYWVKIERVGDTFTGYTSANGTSWSMVGQTIIAMDAPVQIGLAVTSHAAGEDRTFEFDNITATGNVTGAWQGVVIDSPQYNPATDMYVIVEDSTGKTAMATSDTAANAANWTRWVIPMSDLAGVNFARITKLTIGVGDKAASAPGGAGIVFIDDIGYGRSATE